MAINTETNDFKHATAEGTCLQPRQAVIKYLNFRAMDSIDKTYQRWKMTGFLERSKLQAFKTKFSWDTLVFKAPQWPEAGTVQQSALKTYNLGGQLRKEPQFFFCWKMKFNDASSLPSVCERSFIEMWKTFDCLCKFVKNVFQNASGQVRLLPSFFKKQDLDAFTKLRL